MNRDEDFFLRCKYCGGEFDGNGDCPSYCEDDFCGVCQKDVDDNHTHIKKRHYE